MRYTFHDRRWNNNENRLIHQHGPEFAGPAPGQGLPTYEQLYYNYQQAIARLQKLEHQMLNMQTNAPRGAQNWASQEATTAQQMHLYRMGGSFAMGAAPQRYSNIGTRARLWNNQMQYRQYQQQWQQQQHQVRNSPVPPQPEHLRGFGRNPNAAESSPARPAQRRRDMRRVAPRGPRSAEMQEQNMPTRNRQASNLPSYLTGDWIGGGSTERDRKENNVYFYRNTPEGYVPELVRSRGRFVRGERPGREPSEPGNRAGGFERRGERRGDSLRISSSFEGRRKFISEMRDWARTLPPSLRVEIDPYLDAFEQMDESRARMEAAALRDDLQGAQKHANEVSACIQDLFALFPAEHRRTLIAMLRARGVMRGSEPLGRNYELVWNVSGDANVTLQVRGRTNRAGPGRAETARNYAPRPGLNDAQTKEVHARFEAIRKLGEDLSRAKSERTKVQGQLKNIQANLVIMRLDRHEFQKETAERLEKLQADLKAGAGNIGELEKSIDELTRTLKERLGKMNGQIEDFERQVKLLATQVDTLNKLALSLEADINRRLELEAKYRREL